MALLDFRFKPYRQLLNNPPELDTGVPAIENDPTRTKVNASELAEYGIATLPDGTKYDYQLTLGGSIDITSTDISDALNNSTIRSLDLIWIGKGSVSLSDFRVSLAEFQGLDTNGLSKLGDATVWGSEFNDYLNPDKGDDEIKGFGGDDTIVGGAGQDKVVFRGLLNDYTIDYNDDYFTIKDNRSLSPDGVDTVSDVEIYEFSDQTLSEDELKSYSKKSPWPIPIDDITTQNKISTFQLSEPISVGNQDIETVIVGTKKKDKITGTSASEVLAGQEGKDALKGGDDADGFLFNAPNGFGKKQADVIKDFDPDEGDSLLVDKDVFGLGKKIKLKVVTGNKASKKAAKSKNDFVYDEKNGLLYFNENGKQKGWGDGGLFAKLQGAPELGADDFAIV